jgi:hypothetical protein
MVSSILGPGATSCDLALDSGRWSQILRPGQVVATVHDLGGNVKAGRDRSSRDCDRSQTSVELQ